MLIVSSVRAVDSGRHWMTAWHMFTAFATVHCSRLPAENLCSWISARAFTCRCLGGSDGVDQFYSGHGLASAMYFRITS